MGKRLILLSIAFASTVFIGTPAMSSEWVEVPDGQIDVSSIKANTEGNVEFWEKSIWPQEVLKGDYPNYSHTMTLGEIDCKRKLLRSKLVLVYNKSGSTFDGERSSPTKFQPIVPDSIGEQVYIFLCSNR